MNQIKCNNVILHDPLLVTQAFNQHFSSVCFALISDSPTGGDFNNVLSSHRSFSFRRITPVEVQEVINGLKVSSDPGLDGTETKFFKLSSHILMYPLCDLFNMPLFTSEIPAIWKCSRITPLHKGGDIGI